MSNEDKTEKYFYTDAETGQLLEVSKEMYERQIGLMKLVTPNDMPIQGKVLILGTGSKIDHDDDGIFKEIQGDPLYWNLYPLSPDDCFKSINIVKHE